MQSTILFRAFLLTSIFMTPAYEPAVSLGELKVTKRTAVLRGGPRRCGLVLDDVWKVSTLILRKTGYVLLSFRKARHRKPGRFALG